MDIKKLVQEEIEKQLGLVEEGMDSVLIEATANVIDSIESVLNLKRSIENHSEDLNFWLDSLKRFYNQNSRKAITSKIPKKEISVIESKIEKLDDMISDIMNDFDDYLDYDMDNAYIPIQDIKKVLRNY